MSAYAAAAGGYHPVYPRALTPARSTPVPDLVLPPPSPGSPRGERNDRSSTAVGGFLIKFLRHGLPYLGAGYQAGTEVEFQGMIGTYPILPETSGHVVIGIGIGKSGAPGYAGGYLPFTRMAS